MEKTITIQPKAESPAPYGYADGRNGGFDPHEIRVWNTSELVRVDTYSRRRGKYPPNVIALHRDYARALGQALIEASGS